MYRVLSAQKVDLYCVRNNCNFNCGLFHTPEARRNAKKSLRDRRAKQFRVKSLDMGSLKNDKKQEVRTANSDEPPKTNFLGIQPNAIEPMTPLPLSGASTVTLEDIISSAKRKISQEYIDLRIKSPELNDSDTEMHHLAKQRNLIGGTPWPKDIYLTDESDHKEDVSYVEHLINSSSDEEEWVDKNPPSIIEDGDIDEDFEEVLKAAQPPPDHYSNPLYRKADKLSRARRKISDLYDDNSSVDLSVADLDLAEVNVDWDHLNLALLQSRLTNLDKHDYQYEDNL